MFIVTTNDISSGTGGAESPKLLIQNPISAKNARLVNIILGTNVSTNNNIFRFYLGPTVSAVGTVVTPVCLDTAAALIPTMVVYMNPTISNNGTLFANFIVGPTTSASIPFAQGVTIAPGKSILLTVRPNTGGVTSSYNVTWEE